MAHAQILVRWGSRTRTSALFHRRTQPEVNSVPSVVQAIFNLCPGIIVIQLTSDNSNLALAGTKVNFPRISFIHLLRVEN